MHQVHVEPWDCQRKGWGYSGPTTCSSDEIENEIHFLTGCPKTHYVRQRHPVARETKTLLEDGGNANDILKDLLCSNIKSIAAWVEDTWIERKKHLYT